MTEGKQGHPRRVVLCGEYATRALEATVLERLRFLAQLRVALWRLRWTLWVASLRRLGADAYRVGLVECNKMLAAKA